MYRDLRVRLRSRYSQINQADLNGFFIQAKRFFSFFDEVEVLRSLRDELLANYPEGQEEVEKIERGVALYSTTEMGAAALGYLVFRRFSEAENPMAFLQYSAGLEEFVQVYVRPLFDHLDEHLDDQDSVLAALVRFKHTCEWFRAEELYNLFESNRSTGERCLAWKMYEYLYQLGIEFSIEPASASGEADMVSAQNSDNPLVADAKVFIPESGRGASYITNGLHQLYRYLCDFNKPIGYLVVFGATEKRLVFAAEFLKDGTPLWRHNEKMLFIIVVDIFPHTQSASGRRVPDTVTVTLQDVVRSEE